MGFSSWQGTVGVVKPTFRPGATEELIRILPVGIGVIPLFIGISKGTTSEFRAALSAMEEKVAALAELDIDMLHAEGGPILMYDGFDVERARLAEWERKYAKPMSSSGSTHVAAMRALGMTDVVGVTYVNAETSDLCAGYLRGAGFNVLEMQPMNVSFEAVSYLSHRAVYAAAKAAFKRNPSANGIYLFGSGWRILEVIEPLERDLGVPVLHPVTARAWFIQRYLRVLERRTGLGRLLAEMPPLPG